MPAKKDSAMKNSAAVAQVTSHSAAVAQATSQSGFVKDFVKALKDDSVMAALGAAIEEIVDTQLKAAVALLKEENARLRRDLHAATDRIKLLEAHDQKSNLIIAGLPISSWSEAASTTSNDEHGHTAEHTEVTETSVL